MPEIVTKEFSDHQDEKIHIGEKPRKGKIRLDLDFSRAAINDRIQWSNFLKSQKKKSCTDFIFS